MGDSKSLGINQKSEVISEYSDFNIFLIRELSWPGSSSHVESIVRGAVKDKRGDFFGVMFVYP